MCGKKNILVENSFPSDGNSVCAHVHGFHPYIFVPVTPEFKKDYLAEFRRNMNQVNYLLGQLFLLGSFIKVIVADIKNNVDNVVDAVLSCELVEKSTIYGFQGNKQSNFIKITLAVPKMVAAARRLIEKGEVSAPHGK